MASTKYEAQSNCFNYYSAHFIVRHTIYYINYTISYEIKIKVDTSKGKGYNTLASPLNLPLSTCNTLFSNQPK